MLARQLVHAAAFAVLLAITGCATAPAGRPVSRVPEAPTANLQVSEMVVAALGLVGVPYRLGGNDAENGFDCSGLTRHLFQSHLGHSLPRRSQEQAGASSLADVPRDALQPGDLVFFNTLQREYSHVGIYVGDGRFVHAPRTGSLVRIEQMRSDYWARRFDGARRLSVLAADPGATSPR